MRNRLALIAIAVALFLAAGICWFGGKHPGSSTASREATASPAASASSPPATDPDPASHKISERPAPASSSLSPLERILAGIVVPEVDLREMPLGIAAQFCQTQFKQLCPPDAEIKAIGIVIKNATGVKNSAFDGVLPDITLKNVSLLDLLHRVANQAHMKLEFDSYAVTFLPENYPVLSAEQLQRFPVSPDADKGFFMISSWTVGDAFHDPKYVTIDPDVDLNLDVGSLYIPEPLPFGYVFQKMLQGTGNEIYKTGPEAYHVVRDPTARVAAASIPQPKGPQARIIRPAQ